MNWFKRKLREDWRLVATKEATVHWTDLKRDEIVYYYLYESNFGRRRVEIRETGYCKEYSKGPEIGYYLKFIYPWSKGENFTDTNGNELVATYWDKVTQENTAHVDRLYKLLLAPDNPNIKNK